jgi:hypothetical protein
MPFEVSVWGTKSSTLYISTNGIISLTSDPLTAQPSQDLPDYSLPAGALIMPYFGRSSIFSGYRQHITAMVSGTTCALAVTLVFALASRCDSVAPINFSVIFYQNNPGVFDFYYGDVYDGGSHGLIGIQNSYQSRSLEYEYADSGTVWNGLQVHIDTVDNTVTEPS